MSLGEKLEVTIEPQWAYRKTGLQDDNGTYLVPPVRAAAARRPRPKARSRRRAPDAPTARLCAVRQNASLHFELRLVQVRDKTVEAN
jgi:hypothetical protein